MAAIPTWQEHWQVPFMSLDGISYTISIYEWDYQGSIVTLKGGPDPFVTQEDDSDDIFTNIRVQTGYINIILDPASIPAEADYLAAIAPKNNTEKMVRLKHSEGNNTVIDWQGFLQAQLFDQPWNQTARLIQMPVKSMLACLEDVEIPATAMEKNLSPIAKFFTTAYANLLREDVAPYDNFIFIDDATGWTFMRYYVMASAFFSLKTIDNEGESTTLPVGISWAETLNGIFKAFGVTVRESGRNIVFAKMDVPAPRVATLIWNNIQTLATGSVAFTIIWEDLPSPTAISDDYLTWKGADIRQGYKLGARSYEITLNLGTGVPLDITLPVTELDGSTVIELGSDYIASGTVYGQLHAIRINGYETYTYKKIVSFQGDTEDATYQQCLDNCIFNRPTYNPHPFNASDALITGAIPVRWEKVNPDETTKGLVNGLLLNQQYDSVSVFQTIPTPCYSLTSFFGYTFAEGFIKIDGIINTFWRINNDGKMDFMDGATGGTISFYFCFYIGDKQWTGTQWIDRSSAIPVTSFFPIQFRGGKIDSNAADVVGDASLEGFYIPITERLEGTVTIEIMSKVRRNNYISSNYDTHASIVEELEVTHYIPPTPNQSTRRENTYYRSEDTGFKNTISEQLLVGTNNNNPDSVLFIRQSSAPNDYLKTLAYNGIGNMRPEVNLLTRMSNFYRVSRQWLQAIVSDHDIDLLKTLWIYKGKNYYAIEHSHVWSDNNITIKFIEVKDTTL